MSAATYHLKALLNLGAIVQCQKQGPDRYMVSVRTAKDGDLFLAETLEEALERACEALRGESHDGA